MTRMPRHITDVRSMTTKIFWEHGEWCRQLPGWWLEACGCRRECGRHRLLDHLLASKLYDIWAPLLEDNLYVSPDGRWAVVCRGQKCAIHPWPKNIHRPLPHIGGAQPWPAHDS